MAQAIIDQKRAGIFCAAIQAEGIPAFSFYIDAVETRAHSEELACNKERTVTLKTNRTIQRILIVFASICILFVFLAFRVGWIQVVENEKYTKLAVAQQVKDVSIPAKRGTIYDGVVWSAGKNRD